MSAGASALRGAQSDKNGPDPLAGPGPFFGRGWVYRVAVSASWCSKYSLAAWVRVVK